MFSKEKHQAVPPAVSEDPDVQEAQARQSRAFDVCRQMEQRQQDCYRDMRSDDEMIRRRAHRQQQDLEHAVDDAEMEKLEAVKQLADAKEKALMPLRTYFEQQDQKLLQPLYEGLAALIPLNEKVRDNFLDAMAHGVQLSFHAWNELSSGEESFESLLEFRRRRLREENIEVS